MARSPSPCWSHILTARSQRADVRIGWRYHLYRRPCAIFEAEMEVVHAGLSAVVMELDVGVEHSGDGEPGPLLAVCRRCPVQSQ